MVEGELGPRSQPLMMRTTVVCELVGPVVDEVSGEEISDARRSRVDVASPEREVWRWSYEGSSTIFSIVCVGSEVRSAAMGLLKSGEASSGWLLGFC